MGIFKEWREMAITIASMGLAANLQKGLLTYHLFVCSHM